MVKTLESAREELKELGMEYFATLNNHKGGLLIILNNMDETDKINAMTYGIHKRVQYLMCASNSKLLCGYKPMMGKEKEMTFNLEDIQSITSKSPFLLGTNIIVSLKNGDELKFNSDEKKAVLKFVEVTSKLV